MEKLTSSGDNVVQQEWLIVYEGIQRVLLKQPIDVIRFGIPNSSTRIAG